MKKNDLPGPEALANNGKKEGQVIMIKTTGGSVEAHQWSSSAGSWQKIGEVVDAVGSSRKQLYMGEEYDFVFDVDFSDGAQPLKLPFNVTDNPYEAAQKFLFRHELPAEYIDQVVAHIEANTGGVALGTGPSNDYVDPYTGASRYTGGGVGSAPAPSSGSTGFSGDPYTGELPLRVFARFYFADLSLSDRWWTISLGSCRHAEAASSRESCTLRSFEHHLTTLCVQKTFLNFTQANLPALRAKLGQLNDQLATDPVRPSFGIPGRGS